MGFARESCPGIFKIKRYLSARGLALFFLATRLCLAQGGPPLLTDDPDPPGNNHWEINIGATLEGVPSGANSYELPHIDLNYGLGDSIQLKWESGVAGVSRSGTRAQFGWEDSLFGVKWRIVNGGETGFSVGTYPQVGVRLLSSSDPAIAGPSTYAILPIELKKSWGDFSLDGEFGALLAANETSGWTYGLCAGYNTSKLIELIAELHGTIGNAIIFPPGLIAQAGVRAGLSEAVAIIAAVGTTVVVPAGSDPTYLLFAGARLTP